MMNFIPPSDNDLTSVCKLASMANNSNHADEGKYLEERLLDSLNEVNDIPLDVSSDGSNKAENDADKITFCVRGGLRGLLSRDNSSSKKMISADSRMLSSSQHSQMSKEILDTSCHSERMCKESRMIRQDSLRRIRRLDCVDTTCNSKISDELPNRSKSFSEFSGASRKDGNSRSITRSKPRRLSLQTKTSSGLLQPDSAAVTDFSCSSNGCSGSLRRITRSTSRRMSLQTAIVLHSQDPESSTDMDSSCTSSSSNGSLRRITRSSSKRMSLQTPNGSHSLQPALGTSNATRPSFSRSNSKRRLLHTTDDSKPSLASTDKDIPDRRRNFTRSTSMRKPKNRPMKEMSRREKMMLMSEVLSDRHLATLSCDERNLTSPQLPPPLPTHVRKTNSLQKL